MTAFADRMREATVLLTDRYAEHVAAAVDALSTLRIERVDGLLSFARVGFVELARETDYSAVAETFRKRGVEAEDRMRQLWSTLAGIVLIERFERGPGRRGAARLAADSLAGVAIDVAASQGFKPVHPDLVTHARVWRDTVAEHLRLDGGLRTPPKPPASLATESADVQLADEASASPEMRNELVNYLRGLHDWLARSSSSARLAALEEQQDLLWWLKSSGGADDAEKNAAATIVQVCEELVALTRFMPGPPAASELLARRLGALAFRPISRAILAAEAARPVPPLIADLCVLANGHAGEGDDDGDVMTVREGAEHLHAELVLVELANGGSW